MAQAKSEVRRQSGYLVSEIHETGERVEQVAVPVKLILSFLKCLMVDKVCSSISRGNLTTLCPENVAICPSSLK